MSTLLPDPTFYPSPGMAMQAPAERLAYVTMLNVDKNGKHDAMGVVDLDPASTTYGQLVGQTDFPNGDNELHHFGWNACSACLCLGSRPSLEAANDTPGHTHLSTGVRPLAGLLATGVHTVGYLAVTGAVAWVVYRKLGLALLRSAWLNLDVVWAAALVITGLATLVV
jgi:hypothetical protein